MGQEKARSCEECHTAREGSLRALQEGRRRDTKLSDMEVVLENSHEKEKESKEQERQDLQGNVESLIINYIPKFK